MISFIKDILLGISDHFDFRARKYTEGHAKFGQTFKRRTEYLVRRFESLGIEKVNDAVSEEPEEQDDAESMWLILSIC